MSLATCECGTVVDTDYDDEFYQTVFIDAGFNETIGLCEPCRETKLVRPC